MNLESNFSIIVHLADKTIHVYYSFSVYLIISQDSLIKFLLGI